MEKTVSTWNECLAYESYINIIILYITLVIDIYYVINIQGRIWVCNFCFIWIVCIAILTRIILSLTVFGVCSKLQANTDMSSSHFAYHST